MAEPPTLQTARCNLVLLQPYNAHLLLAYRQRNLTRLSRWEPPSNPKNCTLEKACQRAAARSTQEFA